MPAANPATLVDPSTVYFAADTKLGQDVTIGPNVVFGPGVTIDDNVRIEAFSVTGQRVRTLVERFETGGTHTVALDLQEGARRLPPAPRIPT